MEKTATINYHNSRPDHYLSRLWGNFGLEKSEETEPCIVATQDDDGTKSTEVAISTMVLPPPSMVVQTSISYYQNSAVRLVVEENNYAANPNLKECNPTELELSVVFSRPNNLMVVANTSTELANNDFEAMAKNYWLDLFRKKNIPSSHRNQKRNQQKTFSGPQKTRGGRIPKTSQ